MWYYFVAHCAYHFTRWFPKDTRGKVRITVILFALLFIIPQLYVIHVENTGNGYCDEPLLNITVAGIVFTFAMLAFTFLFAIMEPVPWQLKIAFHFFGFGSLILGMVLFASTLATEDCCFHLSCTFCVFHLEFSQFFQLDFLSSCCHFGCWTICGLTLFSIDEKDVVFVMNLSSAVPVCGIFRMYTVYDASDTKGVFGNFEAETVKCYSVYLWFRDSHWFTKSSQWNFGFSSNDHVLEQVSSSEWCWRFKCYWYLIVNRYLNFLST